MLLFVCGISKQPKRGIKMKTSNTRKITGLYMASGKNDPLHIGGMVDGKAQRICSLPAHLNNRKTPNARELRGIIEGRSVVAAVAEMVAPAYDEVRVSPNMVVIGANVNRTGLPRPKVDLTKAPAVYFAVPVVVDTRSNADILESTRSALEDKRLMASGFAWRTNADIMEAHRQGSRVEMSASAYLAILAGHGAA